jgi:universal stress protein E
LTQVNAFEKRLGQAGGTEIPRLPVTTFRRILVVVDSNLDHTPAIDRAIALAKSTHAELILSFQDRGPQIGHGRLVHRQARPLEQWARGCESTRLRELAARVAEQSGGAVKILDELVAPSASHLAVLAEVHAADLILKDVGHEGSIRRMLFSCLDWDLLRSASVPVWLVGGHRHALPAKVVAAVDPVHPEHGAGLLNDTIIGAADVVAKASHATLRVVTAFEGLTPELMTADPSGLSLPYALDDLYEEMRVAHAKAFDALLARKHVPRSETAVLYGAAPVVLADAVADFDADLMVVGVMRREGLKRIAMGSTAERLVSTARCDVLAIPSSFVGPVANAVSALQHEAA